MKILLTGASGYIGKLLLPALIEQGHHVVCCVRDSRRFSAPESIWESISVIEVDLLDPHSLRKIPKDIDAAYYLVHSMSTSSEYEELEQRSSRNFTEALRTTNVQQVIYLGGIVNTQSLSKHLRSRKRVEDELKRGDFALTTLRAGIIIGAGSASFEIIRDLVEKLPVMVTPKWLKTKSQPIAVSDVISYLTKSLKNEKLYNRNFDIGGPDVLTYKQMLLGYAKVRGLARSILVVPVMTPKLSSYWLYFVTAISYKLASALVHSMKVDVTCRESDINDILGIKPISYDRALIRSLKAVEENHVVSSWKDAFISGNQNFKLSDFITVPTHGCFVDRRSQVCQSKDDTIKKIWEIGGTTGWYYATWLWKVRGMMDKFLGGVGLRRGRTNKNEIHAGDAIDFWRVLYADKEEGRLLLFAEMRLPGEAWLEFKYRNNELVQTATFRPKGLLGRLYWMSVVPFHGFIFKGMMNELTRP